MGTMLVIWSDFSKKKRTAVSFLHAPRVKLLISEGVAYYCQSFIGGLETFFCKHESSAIIHLSTTTPTVFREHPRTKPALFTSLFSLVLSAVETLLTQRTSL